MTFCTILAGGLAGVVGGLAGASSRRLTAAAAFRPAVLLGAALVIGLDESSAAQAAVEAIDRPPAPVIAAGDVTSDSAVLWVQADRIGTVVIELAAPDGGDGSTRHFQRQVGPQSDFTVKISVDGLTPGTQQRWRAALIAAPESPLGDDKPDDPNPGETSTSGLEPESVPLPEPTADAIVGEPALGQFYTAPDPYVSVPVRLAWGADLGGQNVCRDAEKGFEIFSAIASLAPDLFIGAGDMIHADGSCEAIGRYGNQQIPASFGKAIDLQGFRTHWRYNRADPGLRRLLAETAYYAIWDDHEVVNDFGPLQDTRDDPPYRAGEHLLAPGLMAMLEQNPIGEHPRTPKRLYRSVRWGQHLELLLLDTRQYRDANLAPDSPERPKTMLGREQLTWVQDRLARSDATWVVVVSTVPLSIPTGVPREGGRDGWASGDGQDGFEQELRALLGHAAVNGREKLVFISADVHFGAAFRYKPFPDLPDFVVHELISGPLSAGIGRSDGREQGAALGAERLFLRAPETPGSVVDYAEARRWFGFGELAIDEAGDLTATLRGVDGTSLYELRLTPPSATRIAGMPADLLTAFLRGRGNAPIPFP